MILQALYKAEIRMVTRAVRYAFLGVLSAFWLIQFACADGLSIVGQDATWTADADPSCWFLLGITSTAGTSSLTGWQLTCEIVRDQYASGDVWFDSVKEPPSYVFDGNVFPIASWIDPDTAHSFFAADASVTNDGEARPVDVDSVVVNLLQIELKSYQASGRFDIHIVGNGEASGSVWFSTASGMSSFDLAPGSDGVVQSLVFGAVPEPSTMVLLASAGIVFIVGFGWRQQRKWMAAITRTYGGAGL
jgi:hypothetical protein